MVFFLQELSLLLYVFLKRFSQKTSTHVMVRLFRFFSGLLLACSHPGQQGWRGIGLPLVEHQLLVQAHWPHALPVGSPIFDLAKAFANRPGPGRPSVYTSCFNEGIDLALRGHHLFVVQDEGLVQASSKTEAMVWRVLRAAGRGAAHG